MGDIKLPEMPLPSQTVQLPAAAVADAEMNRPTPDELRRKALAEEGKKIPPRLYDITSKNTKAMRVVYDHLGNAISIQPGETKVGVLLHPALAAQIGRGDLAIKECAA